MDHLVLAMARFQMAQVALARASLSKADDIIQRDFPSGSQIGSSSWHDLLVAHILDRGAKALMEPGATFPPR